MLVVTPGVDCVRAPLAADWLRGFPPLTVRADLLRPLPWCCRALEARREPREFRR